jgi:hypothetical protein
MLAKLETHADLWARAHWQISPSPVVPAGVETDNNRTVEPDNLKHFKSAVALIENLKFRT